MAAGIVSVVRPPAFALALKFAISAAVANPTQFFRSIRGRS